MAQNIEKLEQIGEMVRSDASREAEAILASARDEAEKSVAEKKKSLADEYVAEVARRTERFRSEEYRRVAERNYSEERRVLLYRASLTDRFFKEIEAAIRERTASPEYADFLKRAAARANAYSPFVVGTTVYCRAEDLSAVKAAVGAYGARAMATDEIRYGGFYIRYGGKNAFLDLSLDAALERERERFAERRELRL
ncbi:MAG: hypothetical protein NC084_10110 [Bacteroides sp.]|nr:hypothetical protein [Eubacterium sp.]MCM1419156.1 hypothetical protein [Roseburia sp.]MCM1463053.1 hypothetical protein [Bacteroides sp.]